MPKIPIDEAPAGPAMDAAVAEALGWKRTLMHPVDYHNWTNYPNVWYITPDGIIENVTNIPPYSTDIAAAWGLDKTAWRWKFYETPNTLAVILFTSIEMQCEAAWISPSWPEGTIVIQNLWQDDKASTYALGRCRAFLMTNGVEYVEVPE